MYTMQKICLLRKYEMTSLFVNYQEEKIMICCDFGTLQNFPHHDN